MHYRINPEETMNRWIGTLGTALMVLVATSAAGQAQQQGEMHGQMHADTTPSATPCPRAMGGMGMMGMMHGRGMQGMMHGMKGESAAMMRGGMGMMGGMSMMARSGMMGANPSMLLAQKDVLELTDDQVQRLERLEEKQKGMMEGMHESMMTVRSQMRDAMAAAPPDMDAYRSALEEMADRMVSHHMQRARFQQQVLDVLTSEQREKLQTGMQMMRHMMGGHGTGG
jgi:Spy/CpxP family protein refolding chaperone